MISFFYYFLPIPLKLGCVVAIIRLEIGSRIRKQNNQWNRIPMKLDATDRRILAALQRDGRFLQNIELGAVDVLKRGREGRGANLQN
ncbi:AsnC family protein, partial [Vogesella fluminis]|uniref:AsnC family protein n=1 Tax=Vogesella fluminis TaxID=1069161 RepID=UPI001E605B23